MSIPIVVKTADGNELVTPSQFPNEKELATLVRDCPQLLIDQSASKAVVIGSEIPLGEAGRADVLLITGDGLPVIVEVKLGKNRDSRREVILPLESVSHNEL